MGQVIAVSMDPEHFSMVNGISMVHIWLIMGNIWLMMVNNNLVGGIPTHLKNMTSSVESVGIFIPNIWKNNPVMFQATNQCLNWSRFDFPPSVEEVHDLDIIPRYVIYVHM